MLFPFGPLTMRTTFVSIFLCYYLRGRHYGRRGLNEGSTAIGALYSLAFENSPRPTLWLVCVRGGEVGGQMDKFYSSLLILAEISVDP